MGPPYFSTSALFIFAGLLRSDPLSGHFRTPIRATILRYSSLRRTVVLPCSNFINWSGPTKFTDEGFDNARQMPFMFYERILTVTSPTQPHRWVLHVNCVLYTKAKLHLVFFTVYIGNPINAFCLHKKMLFNSQETERYLNGTWINMMMALVELANHSDHSVVKPSCLSELQNNSRFMKHR